MMDAELLTIDQVASRLQVSPVTVRRAIARGELQVVRFGRSVRIPRDQVERYAKGAAFHGVQEPAAVYDQAGGSTMRSEEHEAPVTVGADGQRHHWLPSDRDDPFWSLVGFFASDGSADAADKHSLLAAAYTDDHAAEA